MVVAGARLTLARRAGHSLGGAVATLALVRLLQQLPSGATPAVRCVTFACPAVGNPALAEHVRSSGWERFFQNFLVPGEADTQPSPVFLAFLAAATG